MNRADSMEVRSKAKSHGEVIDADASEVYRTVIWLVI